MDLGTLSQQVIVGAIVSIAVLLVWPPINRRLDARSQRRLACSTARDQRQRARAQFFIDNPDQLRDYLQRATVAFAAMGAVTGSLLFLAVGIAIIAIPTPGSGDPVGKVMTFFGGMAIYVGGFVVFILIFRRWRDVTSDLRGIRALRKELGLPMPPTDKDKAD